MSKFRGNWKKEVFLQTVIDRVNDEEVATLNSEEEVRLVGRAITQGDERFKNFAYDGYEVIKKEPTVVVNRTPARYTRPEVKPPAVLNREITSHGLTVPANMVSFIRKDNQTIFYLRPLNDISFLINSIQGKGETIPVRCYHDGRLVLSLNKIRQASTNDDMCEGVQVNFAINGNTRNSIIVTY